MSTGETPITYTVETFVNDEVMNEKINATEPYVDEHQNLLFMGENGNETVAGYAKGYWLSFVRADAAVDETTKGVEAAELTTLAGIAARGGLPPRPLQESLSLRGRGG